MDHTYPLSWTILHTKDYNDNYIVLFNNKLNNSYKTLIVYEKFMNQINVPDIK